MNTAKKKTLKHDMSATSVHNQMGSLPIDLAFAAGNFGRVRTLYWEAQQNPQLNEREKSHAFSVWQRAKNDPAVMFVGLAGLIFFTIIASLAVN